MQLVSSAKSVAASAKKSADYATIPDGTTRSEYAVLLERECGHEKLILRDMARTYPGNDFFKEGVGQETLLNVIKAYANYDIEVGYCQGSPFIVGALLLHLPEEDAFEVRRRALFPPFCSVCTDAHSFELCVRLMGLV
jgi:hypothetical protein